MGRKDEVGFFRVRGRAVEATSASTPAGLNPQPATLLPTYCSISALQVISDGKRRHRGAVSESLGPAERAVL